MSYGRGDQRPARRDPEASRGSNSLGTAVAHERLSTRRTARNLVFVEATVALPVGVES